MTEARLIAVGDMMLGDSATCVGFGFRSRVPPQHLCEGLDRLRELRGGDVVFGNLEAPLSDMGGRRHDWTRAQMRGRPDYAGVLANAGFNVVSVANNHAMQHGASAFEESTKRLREAGIHPCGLRGAAPWACEPVRLDIRDRRLGFLGYCFRPRQYWDEEPLYAEGTPDEVIGDVRRLRCEARTVIVSLHWGEEFVPRPSRAEVRIARRIVDAGASVVLGHHPHVARPVERYNGALIAYSLGNAAADMVWHEPLRRGLLADIRIGSGVVESAVIRTLRVGDDYLPEPGPVAQELEQEIIGLDQAAYDAEASRTVGRQRAALYGYTLRNLWRFPPRVLATFALRTVGNKLAVFTSHGRSNR